MEVTPFLNNLFERYVSAGLRGEAEVIVAILAVIGGAKVFMGAFSLVCRSKATRLRCYGCLWLLALVCGALMTYKSSLHVSEDVRATVLGNKIVSGVVAATLLVVTAFSIRLMRYPGAFMERMERRGLIPASLILACSPLMTWLYDKHQSNYTQTTSLQDNHLLLGALLLGVVSTFWLLFWAVFSKYKPALSQKQA